MTRSSLTEPPAEVSSDTGKQGNAIRPSYLLSRPERPTLSVSQHTRSANKDPSGSTYWQNLNPASCASGLLLLAGDLPSGPSTTMNSSSASINRRLVDVGLHSESSLKKRKIGKDKVDVRAAGNYQGNEDWDAW